ncbi:hypothetical protein D1831_02740 [Lactiplantibacillus garii]|uniref:Aminoglycoside phosphotransferase domain-containing protein n=1 Tax=Lactiplantibacillus garii TaxID=2306423 RepID=A0A3R8J8X1_9LACO|nr:phosphotransferase [Lactiplantibacillus garii]RRK11312.1 hypothetical protein D1831_02740 [Lactiplantibacillus garii]
MDLQQTLARVLVADLQPIKHSSYNQMFTGVSQLFGTTVFVKVFARQRQGKFEVERQVNQQLNDRVLTSWELSSGEWVLVMRNLKLKPLSELTSPILETMGATLRRFHDQVKLPPSQLAACDFDATARRITELATSSISAQLTGALGWFSQHYSDLRAECRQLPVVCLHGDVGKRNYRLVKGHVELIDFERCRHGYVQEDLQKLFYQDFAGNPAAIAAFQRGYGPTPTTPPLVMNWLRLQCCAGIFTYTQHFSAPQFEAVGRAILADVLTGIAGSSTE